MHESFTLNSLPVQLSILSLLLLAPPAFVGGWWGSSRPQFAREPWRGAAKWAFALTAIVQIVFWTALTLYYIALRCLDPRYLVGDSVWWMFLLAGPAFGLLAGVSAAAGPSAIHRLKPVQYGIVSALVVLLLTPYYRVPLLLGSMLLEVPRSIRDGHKSGTS